MAAWFQRFPASTIRQGKVLLREIESEGNVSLNEQIERFRNLIPETPPRTYWEPTRRELGRILRLMVR